MCVWGYPNIFKLSLNVASPHPLRTGDALEMHWTAKPSPRRASAAWRLLAICPCGKWLVVGPWARATPRKKMSWSIGMIIASQYEWENAQFMATKPPSREL